MSEDPVRCTSCGRSFGSHVAAPRARCIYCGGKLAGPGCEHLELVEESDPTEEVGAPAGPKGQPKPVPIAVPAGRGPSRWERPIGWLHEIAVLAMLLMAVAAASGFAHRHDPLLPPRSIALAVLALLPVLWVGGACLRAGLELLGSPARSVLLAIPLLGIGLALGIPSSLARGLARLEGRVFGVFGLATVLLAFILSIGWLDEHHDPLLGVQAYQQTRLGDSRLDSEWQLTSTGWSGSLEPGSEGTFSLLIEDVADDHFTGTLTWIRTGRVDPVRGAWRSNHLAFPYPGPPLLTRWWFQPDMLSTMELWVLGDNTLEGRDLVFGNAARGRRVWERLGQPAAAVRTSSAIPRIDGAPILESPIVLRPMIPVEDASIVQGRAWALLPAEGSEPLLVTVVGLFGPAGGLEHSINPQMLPALVGEGVFFDLLDGSMRARGQLIRPPRGAHALTDSSNGLPDASGDVVALSLLPGHSLLPLSLSTAQPVEGLILWLPTRPTNPRDREETLIEARVSKTWDQGFSVRFSQPVEIGPQVGAPLLDGNGQVAGMIAGSSGSGKDGVVGIAVPSDWIRTRLEL